MFIFELFKSINITNPPLGNTFHHFILMCFFLPSYFLCEPHLCPLFCLLFPFSLVCSASVQSFLFALPLTPASCSFQPPPFFLHKPLWFQLTVLGFWFVCFFFFSLLLSRDFCCHGDTWWWRPWLPPLTLRLL